MYIHICTELKRNVYAHMIVRRNPNLYFHMDELISVCMSVFPRVCFYVTICVYIHSFIHFCMECASSGQMPISTTHSLRYPANSGFCPLVCGLSSRRLGEITPTVGETMQESCIHAW